VTFFDPVFLSSSFRFLFPAPVLSLQVQSRPLRLSAQSTAFSHFPFFSEHSLTMADDADHDHDFSSASAGASLR
jgi:hypothetical protein